MTQVEISQWLYSLPPDVSVNSAGAMTAEQKCAFLSKIKNDRQAYQDLRQALQRLDPDLSATAVDCAINDFNVPMHDEHIGYWGSLRAQLAHAAFYLWDKNDRDVNSEIGKIIY